MDEKKSQAAIVKFKTDHEKGLYDWCIEEKFEDEKSAKEYIPFEYTFHFAAKNLTHRHGISTEHAGKVKFREFITADLETDGDDEDVKISMFGFKDNIEDISLSIYKIGESDKRKEYCTAGALNEFENEDSRTLGQYIEPASLFFTIFLNDTNFKNLVNKIDLESVSQMRFDVRRVSGFYCEWTPTIHPNSLKLLLTESELVFDKNKKSKYKKFIRPLLGRHDCNFSFNIFKVVKSPVKTDNLLADNIEEEDFDSEDFDSEGSESKALTMEDIKFLSVTHFKKLEAIKYLLIFISFILIIFLFFK